MKTINKLSACSLFLILICSPFVSIAKSNDLGVCFLKAQDKTTLQSKINEIAFSPQDNVRIQQSARFFNDLTNLFVPIDTFNYKLFWVSKPNNEWLTQNCFKFGFITLLDYNRRAITRVYSNPNFLKESSIAQNQNSRFPASTADATPQADPINNNLNTALSETSTVPFDPSQGVNAESPSPLVQSNPSAGYAAPQINLYNYYGGPQQVAQDTNKSNKDQTKDENLNVNVNVSDKDDKKAEDDQVVEEKRIYKKERTGSVYDVPSYLEDPSNFLELIPYMGYETATVTGGGIEDKFNMFSYGTDLKLGYRFNQYFNWYLKGRYNVLDLRSVEAPTVVGLNSSSEHAYGIGIEHVASRFLSLAIEYNGLHSQAFRQLGPSIVESFTNDYQTLNLDFKLNFISRDDLKMGLSGNYGLTIDGGNSDELIFDLRTKLFVMRTFAKGHFGLNLGFEKNTFNFITGTTEQVVRNRYVFGLNYGFDL